MKEDKIMQQLEPETYPDRRIKLTLDNQGRKRTFALPIWAVVLIGLILLAGIVLLGLFGFRGQSGATSARERKLATENQFLLEKLDAYEAELDSIIVRLDTLGVVPREAEKAYPYYSGDTDLAPNKLQVHPGLGKKLDSIEQKLASLKLRDFNAGDTEPLFVLPEGFDSHGDGIPAIYPTFGSVSDGWGMRIHPLSLELEFHQGMDIANRTGTPVYATADGVVTRAHNENGFGKMITISHSGGYQSLYGHLYSFKVRVGQVVCKGQIIALMGNTGRSTGPHLHYGVSRDGMALNPASFLNRIDTKTYVSR